MSSTRNVRATLRPSDPVSVPVSPAVSPDACAPSAANRPPLRRYRVRCLTAGGDTVEQYHMAPALPVFEAAFSAFARSSMIETGTGPMAVEDLVPGDRLTTRDGGEMTVRWIGSTIYVPGHASHRARNLHLTRIMADSFGLARPSSCLLTGPAARLLQGGTRAVLTPVGRFVDGETVIETAPPAPVELFHLCLDRHAVIRVSGMEFETYHPGNDAARHLGPGLRPHFLNLFPGVAGLEAFGRLGYARAGNGGTRGV